MGRKKLLIRLVGDAALAMLGAALALGLVELLLRANLDWVPGEVRVNPPGRRVHAFADETFDVKLSNGDLFHWMRGSIAPLPPEKDRVVALVHLTTDGDGFRNPPPEKATYAMVALGDSFTRGGGVPSPWPQKLAENSGIDVLNLGEVGAGPQDALAALEQFGLKKRPQWVILAHFEGNDLYDAAAYEQANPFIVARFGRYLLAQAEAFWHERASDSAAAAQIPNYRYPITVTINGRDLELAFFSSYIAWLSLSRETIEASGNFRLVTETILQMRELTEAANARFLLVYAPTKGHVYLPFLNDAQTLAAVFTDVPALQLNEAGFLQFSNKAATLELTGQHLDDQARLLADFAVEQNRRYRQ